MAGAILVLLSVRVETISIQLTYPLRPTVHDLMAFQLEEMPRHMSSLIQKKIGGVRREIHVHQ